MDMVVEYDAADAPAARSLIAEQAATWKLSHSPLLAWLDCGTRLLPDGATATVKISYDPADRLLSFDMQCGGRSVFGLDDLV
jgi:hypothetical protein